MNTKTDGISSGLVAVAHMMQSPDGQCMGSLPFAEEGTAPVVRLSDADAKLSECVTSYEKEVAGLKAVLDAKDAEIERLKKEATTWLNGSNINQAIIAQQAERIKEQSAALKLAREAIAEMQGLIEESHGVYGLHMNGDDSPWNEIEHGGRFERLTTLNEALAAINEVLGE